MNFNNFIFEDPIQMIARVQIMIHLIKGVEVNINLNNIDMNKLVYADSIARKFFELYNVRVINAS